MWKNTVQKHCSDEVLLAHLDGELSRREDHSVKKHLSICWECRARLTEIEEQAEATSRLLTTQSFPGPDRIKEAKHKFQGRRQNLERGLSLSTQDVASSFHFMTRLSIALASVMIFVCGAGVAWWLKPHQTDPKPLEILARTQALEISETSGIAVVHQSFRVEIEPIRPPQPVSIRQLDVWSEPKIGRYAARWTGESGTLQDAVWRPSSNKEYFYSSNSALRLVSASVSESKGVSVEDIAESGVSPEQLQSGFLKWLKAQHWQPVSFASGVAVFIGESGVELRSENIRASDGHEAIRLTAQRESQGRRVEVSMEVDRNSYQPLTQTIRFETSGQIVEMRFTAAKTEQLTAEQILPETFEPDSGLFLPALPPHRVVLPEPVLKTPTVVKTLSPVELAALEVDVFHHLDQVGAVLGEQVNVSRSSQGKILVQAAVETQQRKEEILQGLADFKSNSAVELDISTVAEVEASDAESQQSRNATGRVILQELEVNKEPTPVFAELRRLFNSNEQLKPAKNASNAKSQTSDKQDDQIRQFAEKALDESQQALLHAWALKHFVERFSPEEQKAMSLDAQAKLFALIREHAEGFRKETTSLRMDLQPVFYRSGPSNSMGATQPFTAAPDLEGAALAQAINRLFEMASAHDETLRMAFVISAESPSLEEIKSRDFLKSLEDSEALARQMEERSN